MITQQHENEMQQRAQAPSPVKEHRRRDVRLSILGVVLALVAGLVAGLAAGVTRGVSGNLGAEWMPYAMWITYTVMLLVPVLVVIGAFFASLGLRVLLRSPWWTLLIVPGAWIVGDLLGFVLRQLAVGSWSGLDLLLEIMGIVVSIEGIVLTFICAVVGTALGWWWEKRRQRQ